MNPLGTGAERKRDEDKPLAKKRTVAPSIRIVPAPLVPLLGFWLVLKAMEIETADGVVEAERGDILEVGVNHLVVRPRSAYPVEWKFNAR